MNNKNLPPKLGFLYVPYWRCSCFESNKNTMKNILLPFIALTFVFSLQAQQTDWEKYDLKGKVKQVKATTASYSGKCAACIN